MFRSATVPARLLLVLLLALGGCATLRTDIPRPPSHSLPAVTGSPAAVAVREQVARHAGQSGFRLLVSNQDALLSRIVLADQAERSLDLQYYIFADDETGRLMAQRLLAAADRGVRVRLLLDDLGAELPYALLDALDVHERIEVRLFNPFTVRQQWMAGRIGQFAFAGVRLNRRMHNKTFIVDGNEAILGGRNIGDAYFDAGSEIHFRDLDILAIGPVVTGTAAMFDAYWNSEAAWPVHAWLRERPSAAALQAVRERLAGEARAFSQGAYAQALADSLPEGPSATREGRWMWGHAELVADDPDKALPGRSHGPRIDERLREVLDATRRRLRMISPYFIPGHDGLALLKELSGRGVEVEVLTNSLAANDEPIVHAGYVRYRKRLLRAGVRLYEFQPVEGGVPGSSSSGGSGKSAGGVSLHAKAMVVDRERVFIGSMNFDPRSRFLNTEMGVIVDSPALAAAVDSYFDQASDPEHAWRVLLAPPPADPAAPPVLQWRAVEDGRPWVWTVEPETSWSTRAQTRLMRLLPIEGLL